MKEQHFLTHHGGQGHLKTVDAGKAEVSQFYLSTAGHQNVLWFQITMHDSVRMKKVQASEKLKHHVLNKTKRENPYTVKTEGQHAKPSALRGVLGTQKAFGKHLLNE